MTATINKPMTESAPALMPYQDRFGDTVARIEQELDLWLTPQGSNSGPDNLWQAMRHGVLTGGKRLRPVLVIESTLACGGTLEMALPTACALELIHCYSLIHDDLPCMDNDDLRRGKPTVHKAYGETIALLAGDALLAMSFGKIAQQPDSLVPAPHRTAVIQALSWASSMGGLVTGQAQDIEATSSNTHPDELIQIHSGKTGALFRFACQSGAILTGQPESVVEQLGQFGEKLGLAFQIKDDLLDESDTTGKSTGKDAAQDKLTFTAVYGKAQAEQKLNDTIACCYDLLKAIPCQTSWSSLEYLVAFFEDRNF